jgi:zinc protease
VIEFTRIGLKNGLTVIHHFDPNTPLCVLNVLYKVGSKNENPTKTGFAHLFEHLMFGGSVNVPNYDMPIQLAGGENNAFTNHDITNYYVVLPANNIETAFWLESDRMLQLAFNQEVLDVQKKVVIEEFKQRYLNQPYGDVWKEVLELAYKKHPYQWQTIGKDIEHIESATLADVEAFFYNFYAPENAILAVCGNIEFDDVRRLSEKWFESIPKRTCVKSDIPSEPFEQAFRDKTLYAPVPSSLIVRGYRCVGRNHELYPVTDLLCDIVGAGKSGRLHQRLVLEDGLFTEISSYLSGDVDHGLFVIEGILATNINYESATEKVVSILEDIVNEGITKKELVAAQRKSETEQKFNNLSVMNKAQKLAYAEMLGGAEKVNMEAIQYSATSIDQVNAVAKTLFVSTRAIQLNYLSQNEQPNE